MKAILFSNFPEAVLERELKPKFETCHLELLRIVNIDRSKEPNLDDADVVIAMVEMMSSGQKHRIRDVSRKAGKRCVFLERKGDWSQHFTAQAAAAAVPPPRMPVLRPRRTLRSVPIIPFESPSEPSLPAPALPLPLPPASVPSLDVEPIEASLEETGALIEMYEEENKRLLEENYRLAEENKRVTALLQEEIAKATALQRRVTELENRPALTATDEVSKALDHFRALWKSGYVSAENVLRMLFKEPTA